MRPVAVLMYHHVNDNRGDTVTVTPEVFEGQMAYAKRAGFRFLSIDELVSYMKGELEIRDRAVVLTFDDGYLDNYVHVFPVLKRYGIRASVFIVSSWADAASEAGGSVIRDKRFPRHGDTKRLLEDGRADMVYMDWDKIAEMSRSGLVDFYSHTVSHPRCDRLTEAELKSELQGSKEAVEKRLTGTCPYLCWPGGFYNDTAVGIAKDAGYKALFTTERGVVRPGDDPFYIKRIVIKDSVTWFRQRLSIYTNNLLSRLYLRIRN